MFNSRIQNQVEEMQVMLGQMQKQIDELTNRIARLPNPPRNNWQRSTKPAWELETLTLPPLPGVSRLNSDYLGLVPQPQIAHVHLCMSGNEQYINSYDASRNKIPAYSGPFKQVGLKVLELAGNLKWELVAESA